MLVCGFEYQTSSAYLKPVHKLSSSWGDKNIIQRICLAKRLDQFFQENHKFLHNMYNPAGAGITIAYWPVSTLLCHLKYLKLNLDYKALIFRR